MKSICHYDKESFDAARSGQELGAVRLPYAFITAVTDHTFVPGLPFSRVCTSERPQDDFNIAADAKNQYGSLPDARYKATSGSMPTSGKAIMNSKDVKTESLAVLDSIDGTFNLATTICGFDPAHVMYLRDWSNRQDAFFTQPLQRYYAPSFDICSPTCPPNCTQHQQHCLLGYCSNCGDPLVAAAIKLIEVQNGHGNAKMYSEFAFLERRVCLRSQYCPGAVVEDRKAGCENGHNSSHDDSNHSKLHFSERALYTHELLADAMVQFSHPSKVSCIAEYMRAFGRTVVLRHVNLFHQTKLASARKKTVTTRNDFDAMMHSLTHTSAPAISAAPHTPAMQTRVDTFFKRKGDGAESKSTLAKKRKPGHVAPQQFHR